MSKEDMKKFIYDYLEDVGEDGSAAFYMKKGWQEAEKQLFEKFEKLCKEHINRLDAELKQHNMSAGMRLLAEFENLKNEN